MKNNKKKRGGEKNPTININQKFFNAQTVMESGDLPGIIEKLDYLKRAGVDIVWLSPCYRSPLADQGYDISDYYDIDPRFETMEDSGPPYRRSKEAGHVYCHGSGCKPLL